MIYFWLFIGIILISLVFRIFIELQKIEKQKEEEVVR